MSSRSHHPLVLFLALGATLISERAWSQSVERIVYASVLDRTGRPVTAVAVEDLRVRENNIERDVLQVSRAIEPFDIGVLKQFSVLSGQFSVRNCAE